MIINVPRIKSFSSEDFKRYSEQLNALYAEELEAWYFYYSLIPFITGANREDVVDFFKESSKDELEDHATALLNRMNELGISCYSNSLTSVDENVIAHQDWVSLKQMNRELNVKNILNIAYKSEETAIERYNEALDVFKDDVITRQIFKKNLADEYEHMTKIKMLLTEL